MPAIGLLGQAHALDRADQLAMIDLNCRSLTDLSLRFVDSLARHRGGILNVASISGFIPGPGMSVYNATKAYVISFSEGLRRELRPKGIRVTALCPGPVPTEFQARAGIMDVHYPRGFDRSAEDVARAGLPRPDARTRHRGAGRAQQAGAVAAAPAAARASSPSRSTGACGAGRMCEL